MITRSERHKRQETLDLSIVIPAFNEAARIGVTLESARDYLQTAPISAEILVVDDGSTDQTADRVEDFAAASSTPLRVLRQPHRGKGAAVRVGMLAGHGSWRFLADADLAIPFRDLTQFLEIAQAGADIVIGSRELPGATREEESRVRHMLGRGFNAIVRALGVEDIQDTQCGYKLFSAAAVDAIFPHVATDGFAFDVEALLIAQRLGFGIHELPVRWTAQADSKVKPLRDTFRMLNDVLRIRYRHLRRDYTPSAGQSE